MVVLLILIAPTTVFADSIDDELKRIEMERDAITNTNLRSLMQSSDESRKSKDIEPVSLKLFRGRSDGWWQAIIKMSNGAHVAVSNEFTSIHGGWTVVGIKGNSIFVQKSSDKKTIRQLFVDMQDEASLPYLTPNTQIPSSMIPPPPPPVF